MKLRDARRRSAWLFNKGITDVDYWQYLNSRGFKITRGSSARYYYCTFRLDRVKYVRRNACALRLMVFVYTMAEQRFATFERTPVNCDAQTELGIIEEIRSTLAKGFEYRSAPNYGRPALLTQRKVDEDLREIVGDAITTGFGPAMFEKVRDDWISSPLIRSSDKLATTFNKLATKSPVPLDRDVARRCLLLQIRQHKIINGDKAKQHLAFTPAALAASNDNGGSASGILPVVAAPGMGRVKGTKDDMHPAAVSVNVRDRITDEIPKSLPFRPFPKEEVLKQGKGVRGIQNESLANYQILNMADKCKESQIHLGNAIGIGSSSTNYGVMFFIWYRIFVKHQPKATWEEFLDYVEIMGAHESDKTSWEATTGINDGLPTLIVDMATKTFETPGDRRLYVRAVSDCYNPFIYVDKGGFFAPFRVPSGTRRTSSKNTERHRLMVLHNVSWIKSHGCMLGNIDCGCAICCEFGTHPAFGETISRMDLELREKAFILGDDFISISWGYQKDDFFDKLMDRCFGTITKTEIKEMFEDAEFLRKKFRRNPDQSITWYRDAERVLAKLYHGAMLSDEQRLGDALLSYKFEAGDNKHLISVLDSIRSRLGDIHCEPSGSAPLLRNVNSYFQFGYEDVVNFQKEIGATIENVLQS